MNWPEDISELAGFLYEIGQARQRQAAVHERHALLDDLEALDYRWCRVCAVLFNSRWPLLQFNPYYSGPRNVADGLEPRNWRN